MKEVYLVKFSDEVSEGIKAVFHTEEAAKEYAALLREDADYGMQYEVEAETLVDTKPGYKLESYLYAYANMDKSGFFFVNYFHENTVEVPKEQIHITRAECGILTNEIECVWMRRIVEEESDAVTERLRAEAEKALEAAKEMHEAEAMRYTINDKLKEIFLPGDESL